MRILHVGNFGAKPKGAFLHSVAPKLSRGMVRGGHLVFDFSDRDVAKAASLFGWSRKLGVNGVNRALAQLALDMRPDLVLLGHADTIRASTIADLRRAMPAMRVVQWNVDPLFEPDNIRRLRSKLDVVDATLVSTAGEALAPLRRPGMQLGFLPNPVDFSIESGDAQLREHLPYDLFYACGHPSQPKRTLFRHDWDMEGLLSDLKRAVPGMRALTPGLFGTPHLAGAAYQDGLASCAIGLNASRRNDVHLYSSDRLAHMVGNGQAILIDRATGYDMLFTDDEMAFFSTYDDLVGQIKLLIADPPHRMALAAAGRARYHAHFNETLVAAYVVGVATGTHERKDFAWPTLIDP